MRKNSIRILALIVVLTLMLSTVAFAAMNASEYINSTSGWITRDGNTVEVNFYITGAGMMDKIGLKYIYLYELNGNTWGLVAIYNYTNPTFEATLMGTNKTMHSGYVTYSGSANKQYYASCWFYAEKNGGSDTITQSAY